MSPFISNSAVQPIPQFGSSDQIPIPDVRVSPHSDTKHIPRSTPWTDMYGRPDLAPPIPVSTAPGGGPVTPPEEKSFLQKYWLPLLGVGFFVVSQLAPDDKPQQAGGAART